MAPTFPAPGIEKKHDPVCPVLPQGVLGKTRRGLSKLRVTGALPTFGRSANWLNPLKSEAVFAKMVNGKPVCQVVIPPTFQPPMNCSTIGLASRINILPLPNGNSYR